MDKRNISVKGNLGDEEVNSREGTNTDEVSQDNSQPAVAVIEPEPEPEPIRPLTPDTLSPPSSPSTASLNPLIESGSYLLCANVRLRSEDTLHTMRGSVANLQSALERGYGLRRIETPLYARLWGHLSEVRHNLEVLMHDREYLIVTELFEEGVDEGGMSRPRVSPLGFPPLPPVSLSGIGRAHLILRSNSMAENTLAYPPRGTISCYRPPGSIDEEQLMTIICTTPDGGSLAGVFTQAETFARGLTAITFMGNRPSRELVYELASLIRVRVPIGVIIDCPLWITVLEVVCERGYTCTAREVGMFIHRELGCYPADVAVWNLPGLQCTDRHFRLRCPIGLARRAIRLRRLVLNDGLRHIIILATPWTWGVPDRVWQTEFNAPTIADPMFCIVCGELGYDIRTCFHPCLYPHAIISQEDASPPNMNILEDEADTFGTHDETRDRCSYRRGNGSSSRRLRNGGGRRNHPSYHS